MAVIKSGATTDLLTIDPASKAGRVTIYDASGREISFGGKPTFAAVTGQFTPPATPTDMSTIYGSASKTIRVVACIIAGLQTATGINMFFLSKRSAVNTGGTFVAATIVPLDSVDTSSATSVGSYTANPTGLGTLVWNVRAARVCCPINTGLLLPVPYDMLGWEMNDELVKLVALRGTAQGLAVNFAGAVLPGGLTMAVEWIWIEE